jgi:hypothetical protein
MIVQLSIGFAELCIGRVGGGSVQGEYQFLPSKGEGYCSL